MVNPFTTGAAVLLGGYDKIQKRRVWKEYAKEGDVYAQWELANSYCCAEFEGKRDYRRAVKWFCEAAENGYADAQVRIAQLYLNQLVFDGLAIPESKVDGYVWYSLAARRINSQAIDQRLVLMKEMTEEELQLAEAKFQNYSDLSCKSMLFTSMVK